MKTSACIHIYKQYIKARLVLLSYAEKENPNRARTEQKHTPTSLQSDIHKYE